MPQTGLDEFKDVLKDFSELGSLAVKGTVALPLIDLWAKLGPPPAASVAVLTSAIEFLTVIWTFHFWHSTAGSVLNKRMKIAAAVFCIALTATGILISEFTVQPAAGQERIVIGSKLRPDVKPLLSPTYTPLNALRDAQYDAEQVWTRESITLTHTSLIASWLITFISISIFLSTFILLHKREVAAVETASDAGAAKKPPAA